jgi:hypothetical protein
MAATTATQLTPLFEYLIRGDTLFLPVVITENVKVPTWSSESGILESEYVRGTLITDYYFQCTTAGITGATEPVWASYSDVGDTVTDGTVEWTNKGELFLTTVTDIAKQPISIVGWKLFFTCKTSADDSDEDAQVAFEHEFEDSETNAVGKATVMVPASLMIGLIPGYVYPDIQLIIPNGSEESIVKTFGLGKVKAYADISRRIV